VAGNSGADDGGGAIHDERASVDLVVVAHVGPPRSGIRSQESGIRRDT
jgi:hypothetical protein